jgi:hypothetical protein
VDATPSSLYKGHRFPVEIISHCVWLYHRFPLSLRDVQEMMTDRGVSVSYDTIHQWSRKFGQTYANGLRAAGLDQATSGILTRCSSRSPARPTTCGVPRPCRRHQPEPADETR